MTKGIPLRITCIEDHLDTLGFIEGHFNIFVKKELSHIDMEFTPHPVKGNISDVDLEQLVQNNDIFFVDYLLKNSDRDGVEIAEFFKERATHPIKVIQLSSYSPEVLQEQYPLTMKALADGTLDGILDKKDLHSPGIFSKTIQDNAYRPLSIAIAGLGDLGKGFLEVLRNKDYVNRFSLFSPTLFEGKNKEAIREGLQLLSVEDRERFVIADTLEEAIADTDCLIISTSNHNSRYKSKRPDRTDLFKYAAQKIEKYGRALVKKGYQGIVVGGSNSPGDILHYLNELGLSSDQLTFPFNIDTSRVIRNVLENKDTTSSTENRRKIEQHLRKNVYGLHGVPQLLSFGEFNGPIERKIIEDALGKAVTDGWSIVMNARKLNDYSKDTPRESNLFFEGLAHYARTPGSTTAYCFYQVDQDTKGFIALPASFHYGINGIRVKFNQEKEPLINGSRDYIIQVLKKQQTNVAPFLKPLDPVSR